MYKYCTYIISCMFFFIDIYIYRDRYNIYIYIFTEIDIIYIFTYRDEYHTKPIEI